MDAVPQVIEPAEQTSAADDPRSYVRADGTLVIDILAKVPCGPASEGEIVVCASAAQSEAADPAPAPPAEVGSKAEIDLTDSVKLRARGETDSASGADRLMLDVVIKF